MDTKHITTPLNLDKVTLVEDPDLDARAFKLIGETNIRIKNVYTYFRGLFQVRLYLGKTQVCIAAGSPHKCLRVADCALMHFWPYRLKPNRNIIETDLNLGIKAAKRELLDTVEVRDHLVNLEQVLIARRDIDPSDKRPPAQRVTRGEMFLAFGNFESALASAKLACVEKGLGAYEIVIDDIIANATKLVDGLDRQIFQS